MALYEKLADSIFQMAWPALPLPQARVFRRSPRSSMDLAAAISGKLAFCLSRYSRVSRSRVKNFFSGFFSIL